MATVKCVRCDNLTDMDYHVEDVVLIQDPLTLRRTDWCCYQCLTPAEICDGCDEYKPNCECKPKP